MALREWHAPLISLRRALKLLLAQFHGPVRALSNSRPFYKNQLFPKNFLHGHGWIRESNARHSTMLYSMQADTPSTNHTAGLMRHGRASREQT